MKYFEYKVKDSSGKIKKDIITADSREDALQNLKGRGLVVIELAEMQDFLSIRATLHNYSTAIRKVDLAEFFEQMSFMLGTDIKIYNALVVLRDFGASRKLSHLAGNIANEVRQGSSLYEAIGKYGGIFEDYMIQQVRSGEESGDMASALANLAAQIRREIDFNKKVSGALVYPAFILIMLVVVVGALMILVIPTLADTLTSMGGELPAITIFVINVSDFFVNYWWVLLAIILLIVVACITLNRIPVTKYNIDKIFLKIPVFGALKQKIDLARFCRCMSSMLYCGVSLVKALNIAKTTISNKYMLSAMGKCEEDIRLNGWSFPYALRQRNTFPEIMVQLIEIGVTSSKIPEVMAKLANEYEEESSDLLKRLTGMIEPAMMIILGVVVGTVVIAMFLPMMSVLDTL